MQNFFSLTTPWRRGFGQSLVLLAGLLALLAAAPTAQAQTGGVGIGTTAPDVSAALDIVSSSKGALLPRVPVATAIATPATGLLVFQTGGTAGFYYNAGTSAAPNWQQLVPANGNGFIRNQTAQQAGANFNIGGSGTVGGTLATVGTLFADVTNLNDGTFTGGSPLKGVVFGAPGTGEGIGSNRRGSVNGVGVDIYTNYTPRLSVTNAGNVGIGTSAPGQKLEVAGQVFSSAGGFRFPDNTVQTTAAGATTASNGLTRTGSDIALGGTLTQATTLATGGFNLSLTGTGNVGIGTTSPLQKLDVRGTTVTTNAIVVTALTGYGDDIGGVVGLGVRPDGGLNMGQNTTGHNVFLGYQSGQSNFFTSSANQFSGYQSGRSNFTGSYNQFSGYQSGYSNTTGSYNQFSGYQSGYTNTTGGYNHFSGYQSGYANTTGGYNLFSGYQSGRNNFTGSYNQFSGCQSGYSNTTGNFNQFSGYQSGYSSTTGNFNQFSGYQSGYYTTGEYNVFSGGSSGYANTTGSNNTFVGTFSGNYNTTGSNNTALGYNSGPAGAIENATAVGANVSLTTSNVVVLGNGADVGIGTNIPAAGLHIDRPESGNTTDLGILLGGGSSGNPGIELRGFRKNPYIDLSETTGVDYSARLLSYNGTLHLYATNPTVLTVAGHAVVTGNLNVMGGLKVNGVNYPSDARFKTHVRPIGEALSSVLALRGVRYDWNALGVAHGGTAGAPQVGLLAQELEKVYPELVSTDQDGYKAVNYAQLTPVLIEALKEQQAQIEALKQEVATANAKAATAEADHAALQTLKAETTATTEAFEARLRRLEGGQAQR